MIDKFKVVDAQYVEGYTLRITFVDGTCNDVDFEPFFMKCPNKVYDEYYNPERFKEFRIECGNVVWGQDWDLILNPMNLYYNDLFRNFEK